MQISVYGTRGSYPVCRPSVLRYGGHTTCLHLRQGDEHLVVDGGSGIRNLGRDLLERWPAVRNLPVFLTHPHWDHVMGFPHFRPLYTPGYHVRIFGSDSEDETLEDIVARQFATPNFAVPFQSLDAELRFEHLQADTTVTVGTFVVRTMQLNHPGVDLGYRFESEGHAFVVLTDLAPIFDNLLGAGMQQRAGNQRRQFEQDYYAKLVSFVKGADLVYHDTNFTDDEIVDRRHWGHSTPTHALELLAQLDHPPALVLSHHDPDHSDDMMDAMYADARQRGKSLGVDVLIAKEGGGFSL